jgi:hypothetical protein
MAYRQAGTARQNNPTRINETTHLLGYLELADVERFSLNTLPEEKSGNRIALFERIYTEAKGVPDCLWIGRVDDDSKFHFFDVLVV